MTDQVSSNTTASDGRRHLFFILDNALIDDHTLTPPEGWLYAVIVRHVNRQTNVAFPSQNTLARKSGMSRRSVVRYIERLEELGLIRHTQQYREGTQAYTSNHYELLDIHATEESQSPPNVDITPLDPEQSRGTDQRRHPFFMIDNTVVDDYGLNPYEGWLYIAIVRFVNRKLGYAFPSMSRLAQTTGMSLSSIKKYLKSLEEKGLIRRIQQTSQWGDLAPNHYEVLHVPDPDQPEDEPGGRAPVTQGRASESQPRAPVAQEVGRESHNLGRESHNGGSPVTQGRAPVTQQVGRQSHKVGRVRRTNKTYLKRSDRADQIEKNKQPEEKDLKERDPARSAGQGDERPDPSHNVSTTSNVEEATAPLSERFSSPQEDNFDAFCQQLADVCKLDLDLNKGRIIKAAKELWKNGEGYTTADLKTLERYWYAETWQGKKGDIPTLAEVSLTIRKALDSETAKEEDKFRLIRGDYMDIINY